jgi:hypothetical protein
MRPQSFSVRCHGTQCGCGRQTEGHSFGDHLISESISVISIMPSSVMEASFYSALFSIMPSSVIEASFYSALFCVFMAHVRYNLQQRVFIYDCYVKKTHTNHPGENSATNFLKQHVQLETISKLVKRV